MNLYEVAQELTNRMASIFLPITRAVARFTAAPRSSIDDPHWKDYMLFYEYFHGDNGAGLGASHQTGWTAVIPGPDAAVRRSRGPRWSRGPGLEEPLAGATRPRRRAIREAAADETPIALSAATRASCCASAPSTLGRPTTLDDFDRRFSTTSRPGIAAGSGRWASGRPDRPGGPLAGHRTGRGALRADLPISATKTSPARLSRSAPNGPTANSAATGRSRTCVNGWRGAKLARLLPSSPTTPRLDHRCGRRHTPSTTSTGRGDLAREPQN